MTKARKHRRTFLGDFRKFFLRGLGILLPTIITLALLLWAYVFLRDRVAEPINSAVRSGVRWVAPVAVPDTILAEWSWYTVSEAERQEQRQKLGAAAVTDEQLNSRIRRVKLKEFWNAHWYLEGIGFVVALVIIYLAGVMLGNYLGRRVYVRFEQLMLRLPGIKQVYPHVKQITEFLIGSEEKRMPSSRVVLVEYPRKGIWTVGLMTGETMKAIQTIAKADCVTVFIPSSPTPFTGYTITLPREEVYDLPVNLDEALRFVVSGGVLVPPAQRVAAPSQALPSVEDAADLADDDGGDKIEPQANPRRESA